MPEFKLVDNLLLEPVVERLRLEFPTMNFVAAQSVLQAQEQSKEPLRVSIHLRNAGLREILDAISYATDQKITWTLVGENLVVFQAKGELAQTVPGTSAPPPATRSVQVISLSKYLPGLTTNEYRKVIQEIRDLAFATLARQYDDFDSKQLPDCNYHPGTGVLVLVGPDYANKMFMEILRNVDRARRAAPEDANQAGEGAPPTPPKSAPPAPAK